VSDVRLMARAGPRTSFDSRFASATIMNVINPNIPDAIINLIVFFIVRDIHSSSVFVYSYSFLKLVLMYMSITFPLFDISKKKSKKTRRNNIDGMLIKTDDR